MFIEQAFFYTCLTLEMAYNNARLIVRPEVNWLELRAIIK